MPIESKQLGPETAVVTLTGRLVLGHEVERLEAVVRDLAHRAQKRIVFDVSGLDYADSSGIGTLVACLSQIKKAGGELRIAGANPRIVRLFQMTGIDQLLSQYPSVADATAG